MKRIFEAALPLVLIPQSKFSAIDGNADGE